MKTRDVIEKLYAKHGSYYRIAKVLGVSEGAVYFLRDGQSIMSNKVARRAAEDLGVNFEGLVCAAEIERAEKAGDEPEATAWRRRLEAVRQHAATVVFALLAASSFHSGESTASSPRVAHYPQHSGDHAGPANFLHYVK